MSKTRVEIIHMSKFKMEAVEKNSSTTGRLARIKPTSLYVIPVQCSEDLATEVADRAGLIPVIVDEFFPAVPALNFVMCMCDSQSILRHIYPLEILQHQVKCTKS